MVEMRRLKYKDNEFEVIVYQHLKLSYELLKRGITMSWSERNGLLGYSNLPSAYLEMIRYGLEVKKEFIEFGAITLAGCEYLYENSMMQTVREYYSDPKNIGTTTLDEAIEWMADCVARKRKVMGSDHN